MPARIAALLRHTLVGPVLVVWGFGYVLVDIIAVLMGRSLPGWNLFASVPLFVLGVSQTLALQWLHEAMSRWPRFVRLPILGAALLLATAIQSSFDLYWLRWMALTMFKDWQIWALTINVQRLSTVGILYLWTFCLSLSLLWAMHVRGAAQVTAVRAANAEAAAARSEAAALRLQLNPHFMFNALNSVSSLVLVDRKAEAEEMILRLCDFLRGSLDTDPTADVPLTREFEVIAAYLGIEAARFGDNLTTRIEMEPALAQHQVPNFILQPLVENAIKHGVAKTRGPSCLAVIARAEGSEVVLCVENSLGEPDERRSRRADGREGIGLHIIRQRLANRYGASGSLEAGPVDGHYRAIIRLPLS